jgi:hypothetical protein
LSPKRRPLRPAEANRLETEATKLRKAVKERAELGLVRVYTRRLGDDRFDDAVRAWAANALARLDPPGEGRASKRA